MGWIPHVSLGKCQKDQCPRDTAITALKCAPHRNDDRWMIKKNCLTLVLVKAENLHVFARRWPLKDRCCWQYSRETEIGRISFYGWTRSGVCDPYRGIVPRENKHYSLICTLLCIVISKTAGQQHFFQHCFHQPIYYEPIWSRNWGLWAPQQRWWGMRVCKYIQLSHFNFAALKGKVHTQMRS